MSGAMTYGQSESNGLTLAKEKFLSRSCRQTWGGRSQIKTKITAKMNTYLYLY